MASSLTPSKATLLAAFLASTSDLPRLALLISEHSSILAGETLLRVLLCLPETTSPTSYTPFVDFVLSRTPLSSNDAPTLDTTFVSKLTEDTARRRLRRSLPSLELDSTVSAPTKEDLVSAFLIARSLRIDAETGALSIITELLKPYQHLVPVKKFYLGHVQILEKLVYGFSREPAPTLHDFRRMPVEEALEVMISDPETVVRDLEQMVEPYMAIQNVKEWTHVWARLSALPFSNFVDVVRRWTPPKSVLSEFAAAALAACYRCSDTHGKIWDEMHSVHRRVDALLGATLEDGEVPNKLGDLANPDNPLFRPTRSALRLIDVCITSSAILCRPVAETTRLKLEGTRELQLAVLRQYIRTGVDWNKRDDDEWRKVRDGARWMHTKSGVLAQLSIEEVEHVLIAGMLSGARFALVKNIYVGRSGGLAVEAVEKFILEAFGEFFDNASNGNRTRGSMKNAYQCVQILYPQSSNSQPLERAYRLIAATHALSNYSLTLTPGVPLLPVQIRIHPDPVSLLSKLLESNRRSYLQPDALVSIAKDLALGTAPPNRYITPEERSEVEDAVEARVLGMATEAALSEDDFETAYAYVTTRLLPSAEDPSPEPISSPVARRGKEAPIKRSTGGAKDTLWRTALTAGRFRSSYANMSSAPPRGAAALRNLEKRMELLALSIRFAPIEAVAEVLAQWRRCEEEVEALMEAEQRAEEEHARMANRLGQKVERSTEDEAPQSLFEVARGAARVFGGGASGGTMADDGKEKGRKRDMVAGAVTQGLVSGIGWVLGAQPQR